MERCKWDETYQARVEAKAAYQARRRVQNDPALYRAILAEMRALSEAEQDTPQH